MFYSHRRKSSCSRHRTQNAICAAVAEVAQLTSVWPYNEHMNYGLNEQMQPKAYPVRPLR